MSRYVEILEVGAKNFFRFGDQIVKFEVKEGLTNIFGKNGSGKSTILEIIHYVFFGDSYRGVNLAQLINNSNGKGLFAYVLIRVSEAGNSDTYVIHRGMEPRIQRIYKNNSSEPMKSYSSFDKFISEDLLGFNANTHKKIISVSSGGVPFLKMKLEEKRQIIDNITNISETKEYKLIVQNLLSESNSRMSLITNTINTHKSTLVPYTEMLNKNSIDYNNKITEINSILDRLQNEISCNENTLCILNDELNILQDSLKEAEENELTNIHEYEKHEPKKLNDELIELNSNLKYLGIKAKDCKNEINKIKPNVVCDHCGNSYTVEQANDKRREQELTYSLILDEGKEVKHKLDELNKKIESLNVLITNVRDSQSRKSEINYSIQNKKHDIKLVEQSIHHSTDSINEFTLKLNKLIYDKDNSDDSTSINAKIKDINLSIENLTDEKNGLLEDIESYTYMLKMFSDEGIKSFILKRILPILNKLINYYLRIFNIDIILNITPDYGHTMTSSLGIASDYDGLSGGQKQRINLAVLFAQTDLIKIMGNFKTNILFLDEFIDGAVDVEGLNDTLKIMKQISDRDNKSIIFISHRLDENIIREIDHFYEASKVDEFFSTFNTKSREEVLEIININ